MKLIADLETDGLLENVTKIHCIAAKDIDSGEMHFFEPARVEDGVRLLASADLVVFHNGVNFDVPVLEKLFPQYAIDKSKVFDTLVATRLIWTNIKDIDAGLLKKKQIPGALYGSHKLEAWGYRLKLQKGEYVSDFKDKVGETYTPGMEWLEYSPEMGEYNRLDVEVTHALYEKILSKEYSSEALELEHRIAWLMAQQERNGFPFDKDAAVMLYAKLAQRRGELERELRDFFRWWFAPAGTVVSAKTRKVFHESPLGTQQRRVKEKGREPYFQTGYYEEFNEGSPYTKIKVVEFNPASRDHIADRLIKLYGWRPEVFTDGGKPKVDEEVMGGLDYAPTPLLTEYLTVAKRISQLAEGEQAWMKVEKRGKIHGSINPNGAVTGRATHAFPNMSQVPASNSPYGTECRALFGVPKGWIQVGTDASGLELRCLAHFMARYDGGKYGNVLLNGDIHWTNTQAMGLTDEDRDKHSPRHDILRGGSKTFSYGFLYGAGDLKAGRIVYGIILQLKANGLPYGDLVKLFFGGNESPSEEELKNAGRKLKATFLKKLPALKRLIESVKESAKKGYILGLDKRLLHIRSSHSALNTLLQSAGAVVCKMWLVLLEDRLQASGLKHGWDGDYAFMAWAHDEAQIACRNQNIADFVAKTAEECVALAGEHFNFRCPLAGESKQGTNWSMTH